MPMALGPGHPSSTVPSQSSSRPLHSSVAPFRTLWLTASTGDNTIALFEDGVLRGVSQFNLGNLG